MDRRNRRAFMAQVGSSMLVAGVGSSLAFDMGLASPQAAEGAELLSFGELEPLVALMQDTTADKLLPLLVERHRQGTDLRTLVVAGALANARTFGGEDYIGYHTFMALTPAYEMAKELPSAKRLLPILKVLHRNATQMQARSGRKHEVLHEHVAAATLPGDRDGGSVLQEAVRKRDLQAAEGTLASLVQQSTSDAFQSLQQEIQDEVDVHRTVLSWRSWQMLDLAGQEHAQTLLRQSVRFCVQSENYLHSRSRSPSEIRTQLPKLFDQHRLLSKPLGTRAPDDQWVEEFSRTIYKASRAQAADAVAAALAEGIAPAAIGEALALAGNALVLHDPGRREGNVQPNKPLGSVHGDSVGVHASDAANAWRHIALVSNQRNTAASLIVGAFHTAGQSGGQNSQAFPLPEQLSAVTATDPTVLLKELDEAVRAQDQFRACAIATRYGELNAAPRPIFDVLLKFATSEDGALHAEKYYRTVSEEFAATRPAFRWRQVAALARVSASEFGKEAPGYTQARGLLGV